MKNIKTSKINIIITVVVAIGFLSSYFIFTRLLNIDIKRQIFDYRETFSGSIILGRPDNNSITANILSNESGRVFLEWGEATNLYTLKSDIKEVSSIKPAVIIMDKLAPNKTYFYRLYFYNLANDSYKKTPEYFFKTPKSLGEDYTFVVQSDSHLLDKADKEIYVKSLLTMASYQPDFIVDLGDAFINDALLSVKYPDFEEIRQTSLQQRLYFDLVTRSSPLFLTLGNHEGERGYFFDGTSNNMSVMSSLIRKTYYPNPIPNDFYSGNNELEEFVGYPQNYYAFQWGDALYVVIDFYRYTKPDLYNIEDDWDRTLGKKQYDWFRKTLEESTAKYKFVFSHHVLGTMDGGNNNFNLFEWGGYDENGEYNFDKQRPGWGKPIQQIMKDTDVTIFFQGHEHLFSINNVDGVVYQTLPMPGKKEAYEKLDFYNNLVPSNLFNSGFLKVAISSQNVQVSYHRTYFASNETQLGNTGIVYSYTVNKQHDIKIIKSTKDNFYYNNE